MKSPLANETGSSAWQSGWQSVAYSPLWFFLLTAIGSASSLVYPHPPLVGFATIAGATLMPRRAALSAITIWLLSQFYGYGLRNYPHTAESYIWGLVMGAGTLLVTLLTSLRPSFSRREAQGHAAWLAIALVGGFLLFEGMVLSCGWLLTGTHLFTAAVLASLFWKEAVWTIALALVHALLWWLKAPVLAGKSPH